MKQKTLFPVAKATPPTPKTPTTAERIERLRKASLVPERKELHAAMKSVGISIRIPWRFRVGQRPERLAGCLALLANRAEAKGWPIDPGGWIVWAWRDGAGAPSEALHEIRKAEELEEIPLEFDVASFFKKVPGPKGLTDMEKMRLGFGIL